MDGYSRKIIYLRCATNKLPETVGAIFKDACDKVGWARRVRWDKGKENKLAMQAQLFHWSDLDNEDGTVLTGADVRADMRICDDAVECSTGTTLPRPPLPLNTS